MKLISVVGIFILVIFAFFASFQLVETLDATQVMVIQSVTGKLNVYTQPGPHGQWFGKVTKYDKQDRYSFSETSEGQAGVDESLPIQFADGAHAKISGTVLWQFPTSEADIINLHKVTGSQNSVEQKYIRPVIQKAVYFTGPLMTSKESYAERKTELLSDIEDQIANGVYQTKQTTKKDIDPITGAERTVVVAEVVRNETGQVQRQEGSALAEYKIRTYNLAINKMHYDGKVEEQIQKQQQIAMDVQSAKAEALKAEQQALTVAKQGEAEAARAKWDQEVVKAKNVTAAESELAVAQLQNQQAEQYRQKRLKEAEADAGYRERMMRADNALEQRLKAMVEINTAYADALKNHSGPIVPSVVMSGDGKGGAGSITDMISLLTAKAAQDVANIGR